ncbi:hypothetical protein TNCT_599571 [Trichonephila clavata]|uniref:Uncharacterized protein n=1 Tax=Trichonephila clavata TaxID=2740835 RepID=A0A8X6GPX9_TRICU|nr:hypothetical protein TNCT_599571 [Trichonephila clavata]
MRSLVRHPPPLFPSLHFPPTRDGVIPGKFISGGWFFVFWGERVFAECVYPLSDKALRRLLPELTIGEGFAFSRERTGFFLFFSLRVYVIRCYWMTRAEGNRKIEWSNMDGIAYKDLGCNDDVDNIEMSMHRNYFNSNC